MKSQKSAKVSNKRQNHLNKTLKKASVKNNLENKNVAMEASSQFNTASENNFYDIPSKIDNASSSLSSKEYKVFNTKNPIPESNWEDLLEELKYEGQLFTKELKELFQSSGYVAKNIIKKITTISAHKLRSRAEYYPEIMRDVAESICDIEKDFLSNIKDPADQIKEDSTFGSK